MWTRCCTIIWATSIGLGVKIKSIAKDADTEPRRRHNFTHGSKQPGSDAAFKIHAGVGVSQEYILGPGDVLSVTDTSEDKPSTSLAPILPDGTCVTAYTGVVKAAGVTLREINDLVNDKARNGTSIHQSW